MTSIVLAIAEALATIPLLLAVEVLLSSVSSLIAAVLAVLAILHDRAVTGPSALFEGWDRGQEVHWQIEAAKLRSGDHFVVVMRDRKVFGGRAHVDRSITLKAWHRVVLTLDEELGLIGFFSVETVCRRFGYFHWHLLTTFRDKEGLGFIREFRLHYVRYVHFDELR